ncbi:unnamed protein product [Mytilus coruscus]|uniref:Integrase zinc-binding domain-containing protein n=1 Tax=Mytilus coruscus TaxID=42192 RepID=A0A6J7ZV47_MYTCO|nr:unnamed protein product [Mytilus coruscus]
MIHPKATPVACHIQVPVPLHWQDDVKASLDQDDRLGVIEPVPVGETVTWCHRDGYTRRFDEIVADVPNKTKCVDDTLLWSDDIEECFVQACHWLEICGKHDEEIELVAALSIDTLQPITWHMVHVATNSNNYMVKLVEIIENGMPEFRHEMPTELREFFQFREDLYTVDGVVMYKDRIVVPPALRKNVFAILHSAHHGVTSMMSRAESSVFWPEINPDITTLRNECNQCNRMAPSRLSAQPTPPVYPIYPFQCVCADFFPL